MVLDGFREPRIGVRQRRQQLLLHVDDHQPGTFRLQ
jgi:hypothetical protein